MIKAGNRIRLFRSSKPAAATVILLVLFIFLVSVSLATPVHRWGDASTYYMQTQSIANDFDIQYEQKDLQKAFENKFDDLPAGLYLIKDEEGTYFYGKEFSYALLAAPFLKIFGNNGILLFNALMFFLMIYMGYLFLKRQNSDMIAIIFSICYFSASAAFVYIFWIHTEIYNMFLIMLGLFLWFKSMPFESGKSINSLKENKSELKTQSPNNWLFIAAVVFGLATFAKTSNAILFLPLLGWELYNKRFKNLILCVSFFVITLIILFGSFYLITGTLIPYSGDRLYYGHKFPFMDGYDPNNEIGQSAYTASSKIFSEIATLNMIVLSYDMFYYLFGRFTGLTWYYMPAIIALYLMFMRKIKNFNPRMKNIFKSENFNIKHVLILSAIVLNALFYFVISPNYFGGGHAIGNRYFYIFPAFLFLVDEIKFDKKLVAFFIIAILFIAPININPIGNSGTPCIHTVKLPYSALPVEYTQLNNLPFWGCSHKIGDISYYHLDDNVKWRSNGFLVEKDSDMLINSKSKISDYGILLSSSSDNNLICLSVGNVTKSLTLNRQEVKLLTFSNPSSVYNEKYFVYKIHVSSDDRLWFRPIELGEKNTLYYIDNWYGLEHWHNIPTRWTSNNATIFIYSPENRDSNLSLKVISFYKPRTLQVCLNDELLHEQKIPTSFVEVETALKLKEGENILRFYTPDGCQRPVDIPKLKNKDGRCLSLAFQNIALTPMKKNYNEDFIDYSIPDLMVSDSFHSFNITLKNIGAGKWDKNGKYPVHVSYHWLKDGKVVLWDGIRNKLPCDVTSGNTIEMNINIAAPHEEGNYTLIIDLVKEGVTWFETQGAVPLKKNVTVTRAGLKQISGLGYQTEYKEVNELKKLIESTLDSSATSFEGKCGRVYGFYAGSGYPQIWVRDSATIIPVARYLYPDEFLRTWIEEFLIDQAENGSIEDYISPMGCDKNTVETDQETGLVYSAYQYYKISGNKSWLLTEIDGKTIIDRLDDSLRYVLKYRCNSTYGLVTGAYTADWGDVQFEDSPGTDVTNKTHWTCDIYDNAMFYRACRELSMMYSELGDKESAAFWSGIAQSIEENANKYLWQPDKGFYKMHVRLTPLNLDFTESDMFPMGGNAMAVRVGITNSTQASQIFKVAEERKKVVNATTIGCVLYPPYPDGFFANSIMDEEHKYQNGGQWDWFAGRLILAEFENGFSEDAVLYLKEISNQDISAGGLYEWYTLNGTGKGSSNYTGSAGVLGESIIKGYFGVYLSHDNLEIKPRLSDSNGSIYLYEQATDIFISYNYSSFQNSTIILTYESNFQKNGKISVLIPDGKTVSKILIDDTSVPYSIDRIGNDTYVSFIGDFKQHECEIILA